MTTTIQPPQASALCWNAIQHRSSVTLTPTARQVFQEVAGGECHPVVAIGMMRPHAGRIIEAARVAADELRRVEPQFFIECTEAGTIVADFVADRELRFATSLAWLQF